MKKKVQNSRDDYKRFDYILLPELEKKIKKLVKIWIWADFKEKKKEYNYICEISRLRGKKTNHLIENIIPGLG